MRAIPQIAIDFIKRWEGCSLTIYRDSANYPTIGVGHLINDPIEMEKFKDGITEEQANALLRADLAEAENALDDLVTVPLTINQFIALLSFVFNLGAGNLKKSTLLKKLNNRERPEEVADEFMKWVYAGGKQVPGLVNRREAERGLFLA